jgi:cellulose synthase (UDP-forming)
MSRQEKIMHNLFGGIALLLVFAFAVWWFNPSHVPNNFSGFFRLFDFILFGIVSYVVWHPIVMSVLSWSVVSNIRELSAPKAVRGKRVAFITTFVPASESIELLHKCLPAMVKAHYAHDTWLLDEGDDPRAKEICKKYGVKHFSRANIEDYNQISGKYKKKTKGGNHNSWYDVHGSKYDFVAQIDTDFVPSKNFITRTLGYFNDPKVAYVVTPQIYGNTKESFIARGAAEQTYSFYGPILRGFDGMDMNMLIGANHVIRVKALEEVNHYSAHITEDLLTGMKLHANGWKSAYVSEVLAVGEGPSDWQSFFSQQMRWAYGCMDILIHHSPKLFRKMNNRQRFYYFLLQQHYFSGLAMALGSVGLILYFLFGLNTADLSLNTFLAYYLPVLAIMGLMALWMQRFHVRPKEERGALFAGKIISIATWPIFFIAFIGVIRGKKLTYKVTPKGDDKLDNQDSIRLFTPHFIIGAIALTCLLSIILTGRNSVVMIFWALMSFILMFFVPFAQPILNFTFKLIDYLSYTVQTINMHYRLFEFRAPQKRLLPDYPLETEKWKYTNRNPNLLIVFSVISFGFVTYSVAGFLYENPPLWILSSYLLLTVVYFLISFIVNVPTKNFDVLQHKKLVIGWKPSKWPSIDIFLPTAGEDIDVLSNTWEGIEAIINQYKGKIAAYVLDDSGRKEVGELAKRFNFIYEVRSNRGQYKKAGNLRHGYSISKGEYIIIFDADFKPRYDFLTELLPYMYEDDKIGIVQSPQYFDVNTGQNWLERGAGSVQELFYRFSQVSRQNHNAAICVGSNALYRRKALDDTGGTALIEHSEDVHTGFNLKIQGWQLKYVPVLLAKGLCPESMTAFFKQQYRWCMGSMSLLSSEKFWRTKLPLKTRLSYISGFLYYIHTAISSFIAPLIPIFILIFIPDSLEFVHTLLILPAFVFAWIVYPYWHKNIYGIEAWSVRNVYGWAHLFAIYDALTRRSMSWQPTGAVKGRDYRYLTFRFMQVIFNFIPALIWVVMSGWYVIANTNTNFILMFISGILYLMIVSKVTFYTSSHYKISSKSQENTLALGTNSTL